MVRSPRHRFWVEAILGVVTGALALTTMVWHDWIELVFGMDPDGGSGAAEWVVVLVLLVLSAVLAAAARQEWRRTATVGNEG